jgi:hypothetical protein
MEKPTKKLILYLALIASIVTLVLTDHHVWALAMLITLFSVK